MRALLLAFAAAVMASAALGETVSADPAMTTGATVTAEFTNPALNPSAWELTIHPDGKAHFHSQAGQLASGNSPQIQLPGVDRDVRLSGDFAGRIFRIAGRHNWFNQDCDSHIKVAFQGWKKLSYSGPNGSGSCKFNYSKDKEIQELGDDLLAVAETILEGEKLEMLLVHDRLGLDQEISYLSQAVQGGQAQQVCAIREVLEKLAGDDQVLERVRKQARVLLTRSEP
jgi:hypothetical protein